MFDKILVAVDGSEASKKAIELGAALAQALGSEVVVLHVREVEVGRFGGALELPADAHDLVNEHVGTLTSAGVVAVKGEVKAATLGRAAAEIVEEASSLGAAVIVMGSRGLSDLAATMVGSVAHKVIALSNLPVLVAR
jgi:nucleotide-binding universal stress UspA family protein